MSKTSAPGMPGVMGCPDVLTAANEARSMPAWRRRLWWLAVLAGLVAVLAVAFAGRSVGAQTGRQCGDRDMVLSILEERYSEVPIAFGIDNTGAVVEVLVSPPGTWTVLKTYPGQPTCAVDAGKSWTLTPRLDYPA
jgi:hypothetical protein